jgi:hypothetical protein
MRRPNPGLPGASGRRAVRYPQVSSGIENQEFKIATSTARGLEKAAMNITRRDRVRGTAYAMRPPAGRTELTKAGRLLPPRLGQAPGLSGPGEGLPKGMFLQWVRWGVWPTLYSSAQLRGPAAQCARAVHGRFAPFEGVGNAGCPLHPRSRVHFVLVERTRVTTSTPESPGIPARNGFNGLCRALPGDRALLPPSSAD